MDVVGQYIDIISNPSAHIVNLSIASGFVPKEVKIARVIYLFTTDPCQS